MSNVLHMPLGITNCYLVPGSQGYIMVDGGSLRKEKEFRTRLRREGIDPELIRLIIITHAHYDHIGSLAGIKKICNSPVLAHPLEARIMREGNIVIPPGTNLMGDIISCIGKKARSLLAFEPVDCEIMADQEQRLEEYGVAGKILVTPGHTAGSLSVLLDNGNAMVGDLAVNWPGRSFYPPFAEMPSEIYYSWNKIMQQGAQNIFPGHGRPFSVACLQQQLQNLGPSVCWPT